MKSSYFRKAFIIAVGLTSVGVFAQVAPNPYSPYQTHKSYSDYYKQNVETYARPPVSAKQYTVDKYFYHNPAISPYLNLTRSSGGYTNNYYQYVRPEIDRRATAATASPAPSKPQQPVGGQYYNHWYGSRAGMGL